MQLIQRSPSFRTFGGKLILLLTLLLAFGHSSFAKTLEKKEITREAFKETDENVEITTSGAEDTIARSTTTKPTTSRAFVFNKKISTNDTTEFRPSVHLGEIQEVRVNVNPFNKVHHVQFEAGIDSDSYQKHHQATNLDDHWPIVNPMIQGESLYRDVLENLSGSRNQNNDITSQITRVKFQDDSTSSYIVDAPRILYGEILNDPRLTAQTVTESTNPRYEHIFDRQVFQELEKPVYEQESPLILGKPEKFQTEVGKEHFAGSHENQRTPYYGFYEYTSYQPVLANYETIGKPEDDVIYVHQQESSFTRTRKFPYPFYQPAISHHDFEFTNDPHNVAAHPRRKRISPWKKILHLIGAFLPLGLLLATLTPNVIKIDNTTQPNIILSKLRVADLPAEHKQARLTGEFCEERAICETILAGGKEGSSVLQNVLWNLSTRATEKTAKKNDLQEVFEAAKRKDCSSIAC